MIQPEGPGSPYDLLFAMDTDADAAPLPDTFRAIYPGDWRIPVIEGRPYIYSNFATSRDGRISFNMPGREAAGYVTKADPHDRWLMGLLRMRADGIIIGDGTIRLEPDYLPTCAYVAPWDAKAFSAQRAAEGRDPLPLLIILSYDGNLPAAIDCLQVPEQRIVLATTAAGVDNARSLKCAGSLDILNLGAETVNLHRLMALLYDEYGIRNLLCEGGARVFAGLLDAGLIDEEFLTLCPTFVGRSPDHFRPSYTEGIAWTPENAPSSRPISLHKAGDYLYIHACCNYVSITQ